MINYISYPKTMTYSTWTRYNLFKKKFIISYPNDLINRPSDQKLSSVFRHYMLSGEFVEGEIIYVTNAKKDITSVNLVFYYP